MACSNCLAVISSLWRRQLPAQVRSGIAKYKLTPTNFDEVLQEADDIFDSSGHTPQVAAVGAPSLDETQPGLPYPVAEVAAIRGRGGGSNRRGGRGRGGRGRGGRGGQSNGQPQAQTTTTTSSGPKHKGTKHPDLPAGEWTGCGVHFKYGRNAHFCAEPASCPWKNVFKPRD